jgi:P27 family predicted phage terminase small subunit
VLVGGRSVPPMPRDLTPRMQTAWRAIVRDLDAASLLDRADWAVVEALAVAVGRAREARVIVNRDGVLATNSQRQVAHPALGIEERAWREVRQLAEQLPLSPWGRARLRIGRADADDDFERELGPARPRLVVGGSGA